MHKIKVEQKSLDLKEEEVIITSFLNDLKLNVEGQVYCAIQKFQNQTLEINLAKNSHLTIEFLLDVENSKNEITIFNQENSQLDFHYACQFKNTNELIIHNQIQTDHNRNALLVRAVENGGNLSILATGEIKKDTKDNAYLEEIKAITTYDDQIKIKPNLLVDANAVLASHNATIGPISDESLFYLESKGLDRLTASRLIKEGFLKGIVNEENFDPLGGE